METNSFPASRIALDRLGTIASSVCALHCALCALAPALLTLSGLGVLVSHEAEWGFTLVAAILAIAAAFKGLSPCRSWKAPVILLAGVIVLFTARFTEALGTDIPETFITMTGGGILQICGPVVNNKNEPDTFNQLFGDRKMLKKIVPLNLFVLVLLLAGCGDDNPVEPDHSDEVHADARGIQGMGKVIGMDWRVI